MGRKKKRAAKPYCWYCTREFEDEKILIQHQKAKHFKCHLCNKKLFTGPGLSIHCMQVHKETIDKIPGAIAGRDSIDVEVYGMEGIPQTYDGSTEPKAKKPAIAVPTTSAPMPAAFPPFPMMPMSAPAPYVTGQFFGARPQFPPTLPAAAIKPPILPNPFMSQPSAALASMSAAGISMPGIIPTPTLPQVPAAFAAYQRPAFAGTSSEIVAQALPSISMPAQQASSSSTVPKPLSTKTRIVVPDENTSLEELMANRLALLSQVRYH
ncbi:hypothetical protein M3Y97_00721000 [Aphelenchoides bicaudatus]|nr:hypothetical protein M3Y97_00721000 [Aphelenchoides bicaudatus]